MATNKIPNNYDGVETLGGRCAAGADEEGEDIPLTINTAALITGDLNTLTATQAPYEQSRTQLKAVYENYHEVIGECYTWCQTTRDYLKRYLGNRFNNDWVSAGFQNSLAVKRSDSFLYPLLGALKAFFTTHAEWQDEAHGITADQALALRNQILGARFAVSQAKQACATIKAPRDAAFVAMRDRLSDLCGELKQRIGLYDPRWLAFGLNIPGTPSTPEVPQNVTAISYGPAQILATCDAVPRATHYRFFTQANLEQPEPVFAGHSPTPTLVISDMEPEQLYQVYVSAANKAGESDLSDPATVTPIALAKAA